MAVSATDPELGFLATVSGVVRETVPVAIDLLDAPVWQGVSPTVIISSDVDEAVEKALLDAGLVRAGDRPLAVKQLGHHPAAADNPDVVGAAEVDSFLRTLLAGYEVDGTVAAFIAAEHRIDSMRRFLIVERGAPIAAAAFTIHGDVAVLGGASTLRAHRGKGAQSRLLQHRLRLAGEAGCRLAVATARSGSVSAANLSRAGFSIHRRSAWVKSSIVG